PNPRPVPGEPHHGHAGTRGLTQHHTDIHEFVLHRIRNIPDQRELAFQPLLAHITLPVTFPSRLSSHPLSANCLPLPPPDLLFQFGKGSRDESRNSVIQSFTWHRRPSRVSTSCSK